MITCAPFSPSSATKYLSRQTTRMHRSLEKRMMSWDVQLSGPCVVVHDESCARWETSFKACRCLPKHGSRCHMTTPDHVQQSWLAALCLRGSTFQCNSIIDWHLHLGGNDGSRHRACSWFPLSFVEQHMKCILPRKQNRTRMHVCVLLLRIS